MSKPYWAIPVIEGMSTDLLPSGADSERLLNCILDQYNCEHETIELGATSTHANVRFKVIKFPSQFFEACEAIISDNLAEGIARAFLGILGSGSDPLLPFITEVVEGVCSRAVGDDDGMPNWRTLTDRSDGPLYIALVPSDPVGNDNVLRRLR